jgi:hypothetical protein
LGATTEVTVVVIQRKVYQPILQIRK